MKFPGTQVELRRPWRMLHPWLGAPTFSSRKAPRPPRRSTAGCHLLHHTLSRLFFCLNPSSPLYTTEHTTPLPFTWRSIHGRPPAPSLFRQPPLLRILAVRTKHLHPTRQMPQQVYPSTPEGFLTRIHGLCRPLLALGGGS